MYIFLCGKLPPSTENFAQPETNLHQYIILIVNIVKIVTYRFTKNESDIEGPWGESGVDTVGLNTSTFVWW